jgi:hypothetical protein
MCRTAERSDSAERIVARRTPVSRCGWVFANHPVDAILPTGRNVVER